MSPFRAKGERIYKVYVPTQAGGLKIRTTETSHRGTADAIGRMVEALGPRGTRDWELLGAVTMTPARLSLGTLYDYYRSNTLAALRAQLNDVDLQPTVERWRTWLEDRVKPETRERYRTHLATLHQDKVWLRSTLTTEAIEQWLSGRAVSGPTKRKYFAAISSFVSYALSVKALRENPLLELSAPPANHPRTDFLELVDVLRVVEASAEPYRSLFALLYGTAIDLSVALTLERRHVDSTSREIRAAGTKTYNRDRICLVAEWAWPYVERLCRGKLPAARLFEGISRWTASDVHRDTLVALGLRAKGADVDGLRLHDARHHWAVRMIRAGTPIEVVSRQLGHKDGTLALKVYGRFVPRTEERQKWERKASEGEAR